ncbi:MULTISPECIES: glycoside hydrolase family 130 protein [Limnochorda]|uniref:glycoside hydrolase family 130 protein n=1 Tax=Limnochorda TaxID=1676651 RepID=UPI001813B312|nr:glycoside hydrolase family 130 protein [Limnochorda pilosa]MBO2486107.1 glycosidase [Bacillota bacterium]MBO2518366.1 glycosidase [Bacillota bacterium]NMA71253.1 glycosidase [Bacillota bacterium]
MVRRDPARPIITPEQIPPSRPDVEVIGAFNPGAVRVGSEIVLLIRVAERPLCPDPEWVAFPAVRPGARGVEVLRVRRDNPDLNLADPRFVFYRGQMYLTSISHLRVARSSDGVHFQVDPEPTLLPEGPYEWYGLEDPRITPLEGRYVIAYTSVSHLGVTVSLVETEDFRRFERLGVIFPPSNKDVALFPERVGGRYVALHRPSDLTLGQPEMWLAFSPDLRHWGEHHHVLAVRPGRWDGVRLGASGVPFRTPAGWLSIYHGSDGTRYGLGGLLLDGEAPYVVRGRSEEPILLPEAPYETEGFFPNTVFTCGTVPEEDGTLRIYYGAADESIAVAVTTVDEVLASLEPTVS